MRYIIFGAGLYGAQALKELGEDNVLFYIDNSDDKIGTIYQGKSVYAPSHIIDVDGDFEVILAGNYTHGMEDTLKNLGITNYRVFYNKKKKYYETGELIVNPYEALIEAKTEEEWIEGKKLDFARADVNREVEILHNNEQKLFEHIEIETINRCNGSCSFCPVNKNQDPREKHIMSEELFRSIVNQLAELNYDGRFTTFSNNEPLLDERIIDFNRYAREKLPNARMHMFTNGTLMTIDKFVALTEVLDELIVDNYQQELKLIKPSQEIVKYCERHPELKNKVTIVLRKPREILTSRGGNAPNRTHAVTYDSDRCTLPYKQMIIRPDGKVSLCCNDALGKYTLGDLYKNTIEEIWYGPQFSMVRKCLYEGRENWGDCKYCDTFYV